MPMTQGSTNRAKQTTASSSLAGLNFKHLKENIGPNEETIETTLQRYPAQQVSSQVFDNSPMRVVATDRPISSLSNYAKAK